MTTKLLRTLFLCLTFSCTSLMAEESPEGSSETPISNGPVQNYNDHTQNNDHSGCPCGCKCASGCTCGCEAGKGCTCDELCSDNEDYWDGDGAPPLLLQDNYDTITAKRCCKKGVWLPEDPPLYRPMIADPRQVCYSVGWRFDDQVFTQNVIDVSYGDSIPIYRWLHAWPWGGQMQLDLEGALWAIFDPLHNSSPLLNADYYVGFPLTYAIDNWSFRLRAYHISSHIGDEFLLDHPTFDRRNASAEYIDFFVSNDFTDEIRLYAGVNYIFAQDDEFRCTPWTGECGTEIRMRHLGFYDWCDQLYGEPFLAMHFRYRKDFKHHVDQTYVLGYEWGKLTGLCRRWRLYIEYHDGYSLEGQFCKQATNYFSIRTSYGY